jgi:hypothetical protein
MPTSMQSPGARWPGEQIVSENPRRIIAEGCTLGIRHAQRQHETLVALAAGLALIPSRRAFHIHGGFVDVAAIGRRFHSI